MALLCCVVCFVFVEARPAARPATSESDSEESDGGEVPTCADLSPFTRKCPAGSPFCMHEPPLQDFFRDAIGVEAPIVLPNASAFAFWTCLHRRQDPMLDDDDSDQGCPLLLLRWSLDPSLAAGLSLQEVVQGFMNINHSHALVPQSTIAALSAIILTVPEEHGNLPGGHPRHQALRFR